MTKIIQLTSRYLISLGRNKKNMIIISADYFLLVAAFWFSLYIRENGFFMPSEESLMVIFFSPFIAIPIFYSFGLYRSLIRYSNFNSLFKIITAVSIYSLIWFVVVISIAIVEKPYDFFIINLLLSIFFTGGIRYLARIIFDLKPSDTRNILIYGAGAAGIQLYSALKYDNEIYVSGFIDDNAELSGRFIESKRIYNSKKIGNMLGKKNIDEIFIAMPSLPSNEIGSIIQKLKKYEIEIRKLPGINELATGKLSISDLKKIKIQDLLRRDQRKPIIELLKRDIHELNILVTGAGGSIGSELCRQIIRLNPNVLILFDISESSLYEIEQEILAQGKDIEIITIIGNVTEQARLEKIIRLHKVDTIYHAAAYKHVPLVEKNILPSVSCNIFGTYSCCMAAIKTSVKSFVYISTDKAVRPTNVMGATKRFAEIILQSLVTEEFCQTRISIVRFGNVLGSSGSVVPLFRKQIKNGGPVTITDPRMTRYFMTIDEAAQLVIQAGSMGRKSDIFLLDMGEPVKIIDLARDMIRLSGSSVMDELNPDGEIEIINIGMRPGEKLIEELLIDDKSETTKHPKIMKAIDRGGDWKEVELKINELKVFLEEQDSISIQKLLLQCVEGYKPERNISS